MLGGSLLRLCGPSPQQASRTSFLALLAPKPGRLGERPCCTGPSGIPPRTAELKDIPNNRSGPGCKDTEVFNVEHRALAEDSHSRICPCAKLPRWQLFVSTRVRTRSPHPCRASGSAHISVLQALEIPIAALFSRFLLGKGFWCLKIEPVVAPGMIGLGCFETIKKRTTTNKRMDAAPGQPANTKPTEISNLNTKATNKNTALRRVYLQSLFSPVFR